MKDIGIIGAGAFGTALAISFARGGNRVALYGRDAGEITAMGLTRHAGAILPGVILDPAVHPTNTMAEAADAPVIVMAVPTQNLRAACRTLAPALLGRYTILSAAKGIEQGSGEFVTQVMRAELGEGHAYGVLSGPSFAIDIARSLPTAIVLALEDGAEAMAKKLSSSSLRLYHSSDLRGVEIGGAAKNVLAIAAGIVVGMGFGESARAALIARGFAELRRFAEGFGARAETLMGLSGLGDLVLTASTPQSRNFSLGLVLGQGKAAAEALASPKLAEGAFTAPILVERARAAGIEMPISEAVASVLAGTFSVREAVSALMARPLKGE
ncbi:MAG: NAD(P)-dependent glycerol-3-phosphate dehydrogenase [Proteobacteria bacterium]|nr:NAD(P)-dependent glycerol-3-phosphate dehydrogenase [Pseudomonadota bacterium]